ncbi:MAG: hypothetical protein IJ368_05575 [Oscillospiraceae bacterium]|nr:hypothetical protein [Oscillospiraceae bacterium]
MPTLSGIRNKLENDYLAQSLKGHIRYFATSYSKCPDHYGRASILFDGREILSGSYYYPYSKAHLLPENLRYSVGLPYGRMYNTALAFGRFDQQCFYHAFEIFDNQSIEKSLDDENLLVRIFAVLDRRVGKRRLLSIKEHITNEPKIFQEFFFIRINAEHINL